MTADQRDEKIEAISADNARLRDVERERDKLRREAAGRRAAPAWKALAKKYRRQLAVRKLAEFDLELANRAQRIRELEAELRDSVPAAKVRDVLSYLELERDFYDQDADSDDICCGRSLGLDQAIVHVRAVLRGSVQPRGEAAADSTKVVEEAPAGPAPELSPDVIRELCAVEDDAPATTEKAPETTPRRQCVVVPEVTFMDRVLNGGIAESELRTAFDDAVSEWHHADTEAKLHVWLGLAWREYATFLETGSLASVIEARRAKAPGTDANGAPVGGGL